MFFVVSLRCTLVTLPTFCNSVDDDDFAFEFEGGVSRLDVITMRQNLFDVVHRIISLLLKVLMGGAGEISQLCPLLDMMGLQLSSKFLRMGSGLMVCWMLTLP